MYKGGMPRNHVHHQDAKTSKRTHDQDRIGSNSAWIATFTAITSSSCM